MSSDSTTFTREVWIDSAREPLVIHQETVSDVGGVVWDGALVLASFMAKFKADFVKDSTVVELGCGTGVVGLVCATLPAKKVILTDLPAVQELAERNIEQNKELLRAECAFSPLDWNHPDEFELTERPKIIIASECVYYGDAIEPLIETMKTLSGPDTRIFVSFEFRQQENNLLALKKFLKLAKQSFEVKEIPYDEQDEEYRSEDIKLLLLRRKRES